MFFCNKSQNYPVQMFKKLIQKHFFCLTLVAAISILSLAPMPEIKMAQQVPLADKWAHMLMYGVLSTAFWFEHLFKHNRPAYSRLFIGGMILPILMGGAMELMQANLTTCRNGDWLDFAANSIGVLIACGLGGIFLLVRKRA